MTAFPPYTGSDVADLARALLNDQNSVLFNNTVMLPYVKSAVEELQNVLVNNGVKFTAAKTTGTNVLAGTTSIDPLATIDTAFIEPIELSERALGDTNPYILMTEKDYEPDIIQEESLNYWAWRSQQIFFVGATTDRDLLVKYSSATLFIASLASTIGILQGKEFLAYRTAEKVARYVGENKERADDLKNEADPALDLLISTMVSNMQGVNTKRKPFRTNPYYFRR